MSAAAAVMVALLIHLGSAGLDSSSQATVTQYHETLLVGRWSAEPSPRRDIWVLTGLGGPGSSPHIHVQRTTPEDPVYALVLRERAREPAGAVGIVSLGAVRQQLGTARREGSGTVWAEDILAGWDDRAMTDEALSPDAPPREPSPRDTSPREEFHFHWVPGEVTVSAPERAEIFILRYR